MFLFFFERVNYEVWETYNVSNLEWSEVRVKSIQINFRRGFLGVKKKMGKGERIKILDAWRNALNSL